MATFEIISPNSAPRPMTAAGRLFARMREYEAYISRIGEGEAGRLVPDEGDSAHGLELRIVRAAKRNGKAAETWVVDGIVYFRVYQPANGPRRSRAQRESQSETRRRR
jgi:hypothetical protein